MSINHYPKITVILRGYSGSQVETVLRVLAGSKKKYGVEITMNTPDAASIIKRSVAGFSGKLFIGAGTVTNIHEAKAAIDAGAKFVLSPVLLSREVIDLCKAYGLIVVVGVYTPSEVHEAFDRGADIVKIFPAHIGGPVYFKDIQAPLGRLPLMAVGGVNGENARSFLENGASYLGIGSGIFKKQDMIDGNVERLREELSAFESRLGGDHL